MLETILDLIPADSGRIFANFFNMSYAASYAASAIMLSRLLIKKSPKWLSCALWGILALRLTIPFFPESVLSLIPTTERLPVSVLYSADEAISQRSYFIVNGVHTFWFAQTQPSTVRSNFTSCAVIWVMGIIAMLIYTLVSYLRTKKLLSESIPLRDNIMLCDRIDTPFIFGLIHPKIYLPSCVKENDMAHIISHEYSHIKRHDHWWKAIGFVLLIFHWFNPVLWLSYKLFCKDIELACDERVIKEKNIEIKKSYAETLINCSEKRSFSTVCPLAFGEVGVKSRIKSILKYKKPALATVMSAVIIALTVTVCFGTNPKINTAEYTYIEMTQKTSMNFLFNEKAVNSSGYIAVITDNNTEEMSQSDKRTAVTEFLSHLVLQRQSRKWLPIFESDAVISIKNGLLGNCKINFAEDYSLMWIEDDQGTLSALYKVNRPEWVKDFFEKKNYDDYIKLAGTPIY